MIETHCTNCRRIVRLDDSFLGRRVSCLGCGREFTVARSRAASGASQADGRSSAKPSRAAEHLAAGLASNQPSLVKSARPYRNLIVGGLAAAILIGGGLLALDFQRGGEPHASAARDDSAAGTRAASSNVAATSREESSETPAALQPKSKPPSRGESSPRGGGKSANGGSQGQMSSRTGRTPASTAVSSAETSITRGPQVANGPGTSSTTPAGSSKTLNRPAPPAELPLPGAAVEKLRNTSAEGLLLRRSSELADYVLVPPTAEVDPVQEFAVPHPWRADVRIEPDLCRLTLLGGAFLTAGSATEDAALSLGLQRGRVAIAGISRPSEPGPMVSLTTSNDTWRVQPLTGDTVFGVEVVPRVPVQHEQDLRGDAYTGGLYVVKGQVAITDSAERTLTVGAGNWLSLSPADRSRPDAAPEPAGTDAAAAPPPALPAPLFQPLPPWLDLETARGSQYSETTLEQARDILSAERGAIAQIEAALPQASSELSALLAEAAALVGHRPLLWKLLSESPSDAARSAAALGVRSRMPASNQQRRALRQELAGLFGDRDADAVYRLLWGFSAADAADMFVGFQLLDWLSHERLVVRHLAWEHVRELAGEIHPYDPTADEKTRKQAIKAWQQHLVDHKSLAPGGPSP